MESEIERALGNIGLNASEIRVYLYLLQHGISSPPEISRGTNISRSNLHYILQGLSSEGIVSKHQSGKRYRYIPADPRATLESLDKKRKTLEEVLPDLEVLYKSKKQKPVIKFYEGEKEVRQVFEAVLESKSKEAYGFASTKRLFEEMSEDFMKYFGKEMRRRRIFLRDILSPYSKGSAVQSTERIGAYYEYRFVNEKYSKDFPTDILVWDDYVAIIVLDPQVFATVVENAPLADTYRLQFDIMWKALSEQ